MSRISDPSGAPDLQAAIDRLVAGDLASAERRGLLATLESTPDGWRRCALAFLEDQAWRSALAQPRADAGRPAGAGPVESADPARVRPARVARSALAACLGLLFAAIGFRAGTYSSGPAVPMVGLGAAPPLLQRAPPAPLAKAGGIDVAAAPAGDVEPAKPQPGQPIGWVELISPGDGESLPRQVPVLAINEANRRWVQERPAAIPDYVKAQWERRGFQVQESHRLVGLGMQDGDPVAIPFDEVAVDYVGRQPL